MKIGLLGCGTVGSGVLAICDHPQTEAVRQIEVKRILIRQGRAITDPRMTYEIQDIINDEEIDTIVEVMGGTTTAKTYILQALQAKKNVVTANKAVIAENFKQFMETAKNHHVQFRIEASVGGGIPWIENLLRVKRIDEISSISGIFNGTCNFILDTLHKNEADFDEILQTAQQLGYAEADPSSDIDGIDTKYKCLISACIAYNCTLQLDQIDTFGIRHITQQDISYFKKRGWTCKLMAMSQNHDSFVSAYVQPVCFPSDALEANVPANFNLTSLRGHTIHDLKFYGQGAGKDATAHAVIQDCLDIANHQASLNPIVLDNHKLIDNSKDIFHFYIRTHLQASFIDEIKQISISHEKNESCYFFITSKITVSDIHAHIRQWQKEDPEIFFAQIVQ